MSVTTAASVEEVGDSDNLPGAAAHETWTSVNGSLQG